MQWMEAGSSAPKKAQTVLSKEKSWRSFFCDAIGILLMNCLEKRKYLTTEN